MVLQDLLGTHVAGCPDHIVPTVPGLTLNDRQSKVQNPDRGRATVILDLDVLWLEVAMHESMPMNRRDGIAHLHEQSHAINHVKIVRFAPPPEIEPVLVLGADVQGIDPFREAMLTCLDEASDAARRGKLAKQSLLTFPRAAQRAHARSVARHLEHFHRDWHVSAFTPVNAQVHRSGTAMP
jgi:hypothetical protein